jgi:hypothetical protein
MVKESEAPVDPYTSPLFTIGELLLVCPEIRAHGLDGVTSAGLRTVRELRRWTGTHGLDSRERTTDQMLAVKARGYRGALFLCLAPRALRKRGWTSPRTLPLQPGPRSTSAREPDGRG